MKKTITIILTLILLVECFPLFAFAKEEKSINTFVYKDGTSIDYYIDEDGHEYIIRDGEKMFILLPLEKYKVSNTSLTVPNNITSTVSENDICDDDSTRAYVIISTLFNTNVNLPAVTGYKHYPANADCLRIKTSNHTPTLGNHKINVHLYVKSRDDGSIYDYHFFDQNCTITKGYTLSGRFAEQVNTSVVPVSTMTSCKLQVTATAG